MKSYVLKGIGLGVFIILLSLIAMYLGLAYYYADGFSYNTWINGVYCTGKSVNEVNDELLKQFDYKGLTIIDGDGKSYAILPEEVAFSFDFNDALNIYLERQNPYLWIDNLTGNTGEKSIEPVIEYDEAVFEEKIGGFAFFHERMTEKGIVEIRKGEQGYYLIDGCSQILNVEKTKTLIREAFEEGEDQIDLMEAGCYEDLPMTEEMKQNLAIWEKIKVYQDCGIVYQFGEEKVPVDAGVVCNFIMTDENGNFVLDDMGNLCTDEEKVYEFVDQLSDEYDTVGKTRQFQATRGEIVTVEGGIYGNQIDRDAEKEYLLQAFLENRREVHEPAYLQMARNQGKDDIGNTYIEVDMTN